MSISILIAPKDPPILPHDHSPRLGLPLEVWDRIFFYLPWKDRPSFAATCRTWHQVALRPERIRVIGLLDHCAKVLFSFSHSFTPPALVQYLPPFRVGDERVSETLNHMQRQPLAALSIYIRDCQKDDLQALCDLRESILLADDLTFIYGQDRRLLAIFSSILLQTPWYKEKYLGILDRSDALTHYLDHHFSAFSQVKALLQRVPCECAKTPNGQVCGLNIHAYVKTGDFAPLFSYLLGDSPSPYQQPYADRRSRLADFLKLELQTLTKSPLLHVRAKELLIWNTFLRALLQRAPADQALKKANKKLESKIVLCCMDLLQSWSFAPANLQDQFALFLLLVQRIDIYINSKNQLLLHLWTFQITSGYLPAFYHSLQMELEALLPEARDDLLCLTVSALNVLQEDFFKKDRSLLLFLVQQVQAPLLKERMLRFLSAVAAPILIQPFKRPTLKDTRPSDFQFQEVPLKELSILKEKFRQALRICSLLDKTSSLDYFLSKKVAHPAIDAAPHQTAVWTAFFDELNTWQEQHLACGLSTLFADQELLALFLHHFTPLPIDGSIHLSRLDDVLLQLLQADLLKIPEEAWPLLASKFAAIRGPAQEAYFIASLWLTHQGLCFSTKEDPDFTPISQAFSWVEDFPSLWVVGATWLPKLLKEAGPYGGYDIFKVLAGLPSHMQLPLFKLFMPYVPRSSNLDHWKVWLEEIHKFSWSSPREMQEAQCAISQRIVSFFPSLQHLPENCYPLLYNKHFFAKITGKKNKS